MAFGISRYQDERVGKFFLLHEFLYSHSVVQKGLPNTPPPIGSPQRIAIEKLCSQILDPVAEKFGKPSITYGYINPAIASQVRGRVSDLHLFAPKNAEIGGAVDVRFHGASHVEVAKWIAANLVFDRIIVYPQSEIICVAWTSSPRRHFKMWQKGPGGYKYVNFREEVDLSDRAIFQSSLFDG